ncbi:MAG: ABC transporter ATP-binding protein [Actinomycetota bacterium]|nr:ABC transporter ATP-binding protein [Actinomycetota bacterium]
MAGLAFVGVHKAYREVPALRGLDLEIADGELLALVGPSGSGKSTALRLAAGLEEVTSGTVHIGSRDVTRLPPAQRNVSMVFQHYALFPHLSAGENIGFGLRARGVRRQEVARSVQEAATLTGCNGFLDRKPYQLSGGERQRVALARALARHPDVFLLDEPLSNLDAQLRVETRAELKRLHQSLGTTMVYVTHDQVEALTIGSRVAVLQEGILQQVGPPDEIYRRPANRFVARFIGSPAMNLLPAVLDDGALRAGPFAFERPPAVEGLDSRRLQLGIRPEHVDVATDGTGAPAQVEIVEAAGNETFVYLTAGDERLVARVAPELRLEVGATVRISASPQRLYLFDAETGTALHGLEP